MAQPGATGKTPRTAGPASVPGAPATIPSRPRLPTRLRRPRPPTRLHRPRPPARLHWPGVSCPASPVSSVVPGFTGLVSRARLHRSRLSCPASPASCLVPGFTGLAPPARLPPGPTHRPTAGAGAGDPSRRVSPAGLRLRGVLPVVRGAATSAGLGRGMFCRWRVVGDRRLVCGAGGSAGGGCRRPVSVPGASRLLPAVRGLAGRPPSQGRPAGGPWWPRAGRSPRRCVQPPLPAVGRPGGPRVAWPWRSTARPSPASGPSSPGGPRPSR
ncbi:hypothetical protein S1361_34580 [Streptomyces cyanogenus]|uniref:Uncharacterized protein n=1 Tax=Streptomyces cyanogenus TaxID=80860 RepID=A0ABX7U399_STRCY|nr:hypothetical protein S1361_34580 [Streptomyces cyanogenus]